MPSFTITSNEDKKSSSSKKKHHKKSENKSKPREADYSGQVKKEIAELEQKKAQQGGGFRGFLRKAAINKQIHNKQQFLGAKEQLRNAEVATKATNATTALHEARARLAEARKKSSVNFDTIGFSVPVAKKTLTFDDLYK